MILKARGPGKFCSSRTTGAKVGKIDKIFRKAPSGKKYLNLLGPAGGSRTWKGAFAFQEHTIWLVETEIAFSVEESYFIAQQRGKFTSKVHADFRKNFAQNLEYLAALWSDLDEKLSRWSEDPVDCDSESERSRKIL